MIMEYTLKDTDTQSALEKLFPGFRKALTNAHFCYADAGLARLVLTPKNGNAPWVLLVPEKAVTTRVVYKPGVRNEPDAIPPEGVPMCVELTDDFAYVFRRVGSFNKGKWAITHFPRGRTVKIKRFRSWE